MKILGITAEYNPFHNGHRYHLEKSRELTGADYVIAVMSGDFTQRGEAAIMDKWERSRLAVENGIDIVFELPFVFACCRAEKFAAGAVDILAGLGATHISFGSESGNLDRLGTLVTRLRQRHREIDCKRQLLMKQGSSYARSFQAAAGEVLGEEAASLMLSPNNILAIEYMNRITEKEYAIEPVTVERYGSGYFDRNQGAGIAGATAVRKLAESGNPDEASEYVPDNVFRAMSEAAVNRSECEERAFQLIRAEIIKNSTSSLSTIYCMGEGLENKLKKEIIRAGSLQELVSSVVSRRYTEAAVRRLMVYILMGIRERDPQKLLYGRVLAAGAKGRELIRAMKRQGISRIPVITNINKETDICEGVYDTLRYDLLASDMYNLICGKDIYSFSDKVKRPYIE